MIRIFLPGQKVPEWLQKVEPAGSMTFGGLAMVYQRDNAYHVRDLIGFDSVFHIKNHDVVITGQSPVGCDGGVYLHGTPVIRWVTAASFAISILIFSLGFGHAG